MTVTYSRLVATAKFSCFLKLLIRWRGSIYKLVWKDFAIFAGMYYLLSITYRFILSGFYREMFVKISIYCQEFNNLIPLSFVLGFYVSLVIGRWWDQFKSLPYPSRMALFVSTLMHGSDERARLLRRTIMRYFCLTHVMTMSSISPPVKKRFPTLTAMTEAGFMMASEQKAIEDLQSTGNKYFVPLVWAASLVSRARKEGRIKDDFAVKTLIDEINEYRGKCGTLFGYDCVNVPLVYTQVVTLAVYMFFLSCLMGRQFLDEADGPRGDLYFPFFTFLQFFFYMGWLKTAETLLNPFGEDDDDFDVNGMIDSNLKTAYLVVDELHDHHPELLKDQYWDSLNFDVPYNKASKEYQKEEFIGSAAHIEIPASKAQPVLNVGSMTTITEEGSQRFDDGGASDSESMLGPDSQADGTGEPRIRKRRIRGSKKMAPPPVSRQGSRIGSFFKAGSLLSLARRMSTREQAPCDTEAGGGTKGENTEGAIKMQNIGKGSKTNLAETCTTDELQFHMSVDDESPMSLGREDFEASVQAAYDPSGVPRYIDQSAESTPLMSGDQGHSPTSPTTGGPGVDTTVSTTLSDSTLSGGTTVPSTMSGVTQPESGTFDTPADKPFSFNDGAGKNPPGTAPVSAPTTLFGTTTSITPGTTTGTTTTITPGAKGGGRQDSRKGWAGKKPGSAQSEEKKSPTERAPLLRQEEAMDENTTENKKSPPLSSRSQTVGPESAARPTINVPVRGQSFPTPGAHPPPTTPGAGGGYSRQSSAASTHLTSPSPSLSGPGLIAHEGHSNVDAPEHAGHGARPGLEVVEEASEDPFEEQLQEQLRKMREEGQS